MSRTASFIRWSCGIAGLCVLSAVAARGTGMSQGTIGPATASEARAGTVVATIGDSMITWGDVARKLAQEIRPHEEQFQQQTEPVTALSVLRKMLAEKATSTEGRKLGYLQDEQIHTDVTQYEQQLIVGKLLEAELGDKLKIEDAEIDRVMKSNPKATRDQARMVVQRAKVSQLVQQFYGQVAQNRGLKKMSENLTRAAQIHQRLLNQPSQPRGPSEFWIRNGQIVTDLSQEEKDLPLAVFEGGQFTLQDWFQSLCNMAPPRRPKDLDTAQGVEKLLDRALQVPILAAEARSKGYDQDPKVRSDVRTREDQRLLYKVQEEKTKHVKEPTPEQVKEYFEKDPERFATPAVLKADQIWCPDEETAKKVKGLLDGGADFQTVKKEHSLQKDSEVYTLSSGSEGIFWADLWKGEPNQVLGPLRGFYNSGVAWRVVKVQEKTPAQAQPFSEQLANNIKWVLYAEWRQQAMKEYEQTLLEKHPYEIFSDRLKDLDPLEIAAMPQGN
ncbi:MAG: peptidyl-prolyl cis-trans isomerase [Phycisphaerales bacterium]